MEQAYPRFHDLSDTRADFLENYTQFLGALMIAGLKFPISASVLGASWAVQRVLYAVGYTRADRYGGKGRLAGLGFFLSQIALFGLAGWTGFSMVQGS